MNGVTFVMNIRAHDADQRKPTTIATAYSRWTLPEMISNGIGRKSSEGSDQRRSRYQSAAQLIPVQIAVKTLSGSQVSGASSWAKAGE
jgi:hypothetical protein